MTRIQRIKKYIKKYRCAIITGRQQSKTTALIELVRETPNSILIVNTSTEANRLLHSYPEFKTSLQGDRIMSRHIMGLVEEYLMRYPFYVDECIFNLYDVFDNPRVAENFMGAILTPSKFPIKYMRPVYPVERSEPDLCDSLTPQAAAREFCFMKV